MISQVRAPLPLPPAVAVAILLVLAPCRARSQCGPEYQRQEFCGSASFPSDRFGRAIAVCGDVAIIGAFSDDEVAVDGGAAYVYRFDGSTQQWYEEQKLFGSDLSSSDQFGFSVAIDGAVAVVGARFADGLVADSGAAYVFRDDGTSWVQEQKLFASDGALFDTYGTAVGIQGNVIVVGAEDDDAPKTNSGSVWVWRFDGSTWAQEKRLTAADAASGDEFGYSVALSAGGTLVLAGARDDDSSRGSAYLFRNTSGNTWTQERKLTASTRLDADLFGHSVALLDDVAVVGALRGMASDQGYAEVFRRVNGSWNFEMRLLAPDGLPSDRFGVSVSIDGAQVLVGAQGDPAGHPNGYAWLFSHDGLDWVEELELLADDGASSDEFGFAVALEEHRVLIGAGQDDTFGADTGSVYFHDVRPFALSVDSAVAPVGSGVTFTTHIGIGNKFVILLSTGATSGSTAFSWKTSVNTGTWLMRPRGGRFPAHYDWRLSLAVPPELAGLEVTYQAFGATPCQEIVQTNPVVVLYQ